jgi:hypothetical protein
VFERDWETVVAVKSAAAACVDCVHWECAAAIPVAMRAAPAMTAGTAKRVRFIGTNPLMT